MEFVMYKNILKVSILIILSLSFMTGCSQNSTHDDKSVVDNNSSSDSNVNSENNNTSSSNTDNNNNNTTTSNIIPESSAWNVAKTLYSRDKSVQIKIKGNQCSLGQDSSGISYECEGNLSSAGSFSYAELAKVALPYLSNAEFKKTSDILIAESNVSKNDFNFYYPPIIYKGMMYGNFGGNYIDNHQGSDGIGDISHRHLYEVNEYNLSKFDHNMVLEALISKKIYSEDREYFPVFSPTVSSIMESNGYLYYNAYPEYKGLGSIVNSVYENHKYSLRDAKEVYKYIGSPLFYHKRQNDSCYLEDAKDNPYYDDVVPITFGWMVPGSGTTIAYLQGERMTQTDSCSGKDIIVKQLITTKPFKQYTCAYSVKVDQREKDILTTSWLSVSNEYNYFSINGNELSSTSFNRQGKTNFGHSNVDKSVNVLNDFNKSGANTKNYNYLQLQDEAVLDGDSIYLLATLNHGGDDPDSPYLMSYADLYLIKYNTNLEFQEANLIVAASRKTLEAPETSRFYKYQDNIYFKYQNDDTSLELYSYNVINHKLNYRYNLHSLYTSDFDYAITGNTIIIPQNVKSTKVDYDYDIVFTVLDINTGAVIKTIRTPQLQIKDFSDYFFKSMGSYVYANSVYFVLEKTYVGMGDHYARNLLIKINSSSNKTKITRFRGDNRQTGLIRNAYIESDLHPKNTKERLMLNIYRYLNSNGADFADLNSTLIKYIANEKGVTDWSLFNTPKKSFTSSELNATNMEVNASDLKEYNQTTPLYNTELITNTQKFYIPLLKEVAYSSSGDGGELGEARLKINAQYGCTKSYFQFPKNGSFKIYGFNPMDDDYEFDPIPESLHFYVDVPMLMVDYNDLLRNQTMLRYGIDAIEFDSLDTVEEITADIEKNLDSIISTGISIVSGNYAAAACSTANIITNMTINNMGSGDTFYGSAMKTYTANSNYGIDNNQSFKEDSIEASAKSITVDADSAGNLVEGLCMGTGLDYTQLYSFFTKANYKEKHVKAKVTPIWHQGISIKHLKVEIIDAKFFHVPLRELSPFSPVHIFEVKGRSGTLGTQTAIMKEEGIEHFFPPRHDLKPFTDDKIRTWLQADPNTKFSGWDGYKKVLIDANFATSSSNDIDDSIVGTYIEMTMYSDGMQMGIFTDTFFLDEAIFTNKFIKSGKTYTTTVTKPFYFPDMTPAFKRPANGTITYTVSFSVE